MKKNLENFHKILTVSKHSNSEVALNVSSLGGKSGTLQGGISSPMGGVNCQQQVGASTAHHGEGGASAAHRGGTKFTPLSDQH